MVILNCNDRCIRIFIYVDYQFFCQEIGRALFALRQISAVFVIPQNPENCILPPESVPSGLGNTLVNGSKGDWFKVSGVKCSSTPNNITVKGASKNGAVIKICTGSADGKAVAYVEFPAGSTNTEITSSVSGLSGTQDLYFVFSGELSVDYWKMQ